jgi:hypothetical protein
MQNKSPPLYPLTETIPLGRPDQLLKIHFLEERIQKLNDICNELNPYSPITPEFKKRLREFNIIEASDPFLVTNALLRLLEDTINELHQLKPLSDEEMRIENLR